MRKMDQQYDDAPLLIEVDWQSTFKTGQSICGDSVEVVKSREQQRYVMVLSDGLGSGVKASILSKMTATMAVKFVSSDMELPMSLGVIMDALPVCQVRKISYATFTIVDSTLNGETRIIEMGNPPSMLIRDGKVIEYESEKITSPGWSGRQISVANLKIKPGDRLIVLSDGITQAGLGTPASKLGWRIKGCQSFVEDVINGHPDISARQIAIKTVKKAMSYEPGGLPHDDMTCAVMYYRKPRKLLLMTGPPYRESHDNIWARRLREFKGRKIVCGGTTANILARELKLDIITRLKPVGGLPAMSEMKGVDLVTEGILTLTRVASLLESGEEDNSPASAIVEELKNNDIIYLCVGTKVNEAHQDPTLPAELDIRRNIVKKIKYLLEERYIKEVRLEYL